MRYLLFLFLVAVGMFASAAVHADHNKIEDIVPGYVQTVAGYCTTFEDTQRMSAITETRGNEGMEAYFRDAQTRCYSAGMGHVRPVEVEVEEVLWTIDTPDGFTVVFVKAKATNGNGDGWTWFGFDKVEPEGEDA